MRPSQVASLFIEVTVMLRLTEELKSVIWRKGCFLCHSPEPARQPYCSAPGRAFRQDGPTSSASSFRTLSSSPPLARRKERSHCRITVFRSRPQKLPWTKNMCRRILYEKMSTYLKKHWTSKKTSIIKMKQWRHLHAYMDFKLNIPFYLSFARRCMHSPERWQRKRESEKQPPWGQVQCSLFPPFLLAGFGHAHTHPAYFSIGRAPPRPPRMFFKPLGLGLFFFFFGEMYFKNLMKPLEINEGTW